MAERQPVRIGIVGAGGIVRSRHLPGLRKIDGVEVVAVVNRTPASSRRAAVELDIPEPMDDWPELVCRDDLDTVLIGTWPYMHCPVTLAALEAGKHVFCQARMAMNLEEASRMLRAARASDRVTMLCPPPHGLKGDRVMARLLAEKFVGEVRLVRLTSLGGAYADASQPLMWRQDARLSGRNVLALGIYAEVIHRWLGGARRLSAMMHTFIPERRVAGKSEMVRVEIPDSVAVIGEMESGAELHVAMSGAVRHAPKDTLEVYGDAGGLIYNFGEETICGARGAEGWREIPIGPDEERLWTVEEDFVAAIRSAPGTRDVHPDFRDGYRYMEFVEAVWLSHQRGRCIDLPLAV